MPSLCYKSPKELLMIDAATAFNRLLVLHRQVDNLCSLWRVEILRLLLQTSGP